MSQQQQFFSIEHPFQVNVELMDASAVLPDQDGFDALIPAPFKLATNLSHIETQALRPLRSLGENAHDLVEFLNLQSKKIDLMMNYILTLGAENQQRLSGTSFGGSNLTYLSQESLDIGRLLKIKIFIEENNCAIFCIGRVIEATNSDDMTQINIEIVMIDEEDREQLVRTSLHVQSLQLKERAQLRNAAPPSTN